VPFNAFNRAIAAARINLNLTRRAHAGLFASSTARPFELAMAGAAIVSNPYEGVERWFEPGHELLVAHDEDEATSLYGELLADPATTEELGRRARERALDEHTYAHRARRVLDLLGLTSQAAEPVEAARG
jgi:spore maturation protein CgeB